MNPQNNLTIKINDNLINVDQKKSIEFITSILHLSGILSKIGGLQLLYDHSFSPIDSLQGFIEKDCDTVL